MVKYHVAKELKRTEERKHLAAEIAERDNETREKEAKQDSSLEKLDVDKFVHDRIEQEKARYLARYGSGIPESETTRVSGEKKGASDNERKQDELDPQEKNRIKEEQQLADIVV